ncbi:MAG TPA: hypothetical protein VKT22_01820, partial [Steroidobacteraceae bacterium]|nr:hypothetical protein [Steroidobacteraceae bacterium]
GADSWGPRVESAIKQQSVDLRRFIVASLDSFAARITADLRHVTPVAPAPLSFAAPEPPAAPRRAALWPWPVATALLAVIALLGVLGWLGAREDLAKVRNEIATLRSAHGELMRSRDQLAGSVKDLAAALAASSSAPSAAAAGAAATGLPRAELVPYGEVPFDRSRTEALREVLAKLEAQGFRGALKVTSSSGVFCLSGNASDGFAPASPGLLASKCDLVGNPFDESLVGQSRESLSFANVVAGVRQRSGGAIAVTLENAGGAHPGTPYPPRSESLTAGEWNRAAQANNRVEFTAEPAP